MFKLNSSIVLKGNIIELHPLENDHFPELILLARDKRIWEFIPLNMNSDDQVLNKLQEALIQKNAGTQLPFIVLHKSENKIIGSTRLMNIEPEHRKLEIGWTWLHPDFWKTPVNLECKFLLMTHCFEELNTIRVQLRTDENNIRSKKAIQKIGASYEGTFRNDLIRENGTFRNSAYFSIIDTEWLRLKELFIAKLENEEYDKIR